MFSNQIQLVLLISAFLLLWLSNKCAVALLFAVSHGYAVRTACKAKSC
jgi:hypothetical protein